MYKHLLQCGTLQVPSVSGGTSYWLLPSLVPGLGVELACPCGPGELSRTAGGGWEAL